MIFCFTNYTILEERENILKIKKTVQRNSTISLNSLKLELQTIQLPHKLLLYSNEL